MKKESGKLKSIFFITSLAVVLIVVIITLVFGQGLAPLIYTPVGMPDVTFNHSTHSREKGMTCRNCHPAMFKMKQGTTGITMDAILKGEYCGKCHDGTRAFGIKGDSDCAQCHKGSPGERPEGTPTTIPTAIPTAVPTPTPTASPTNSPTVSPGGPG